jgi:chromate transporter
MQTPDISEISRVFARIGLLSFGGPAAQIALMHRELVEARNWLSEKDYLSALSFCMLLPGPEAMQLATYAGWKLHGTRGGLIAGVLFVLPGALVVLALAMLYAYLGQLPLVQALFLGVKATVIVIVLQALLNVARKSLRSGLHWAIATLSFVAIFVFALPFPLIIACAALAGALTPGPRSQSTGSAPPAHRDTGKTIAVWGTLWLLPLATLWLSGADMLTDLALFFSKLAVVTFGGAYAVLAYMTQEAVTDFGWLTTAEMMDGLGLAETTPGPLILVTEFVGFLAGFREGGIALGLLAACVTLWMTFVPCFLWIFAGAPYLDWVSRQPRLAGALSAISAAVVGVILNLSLWFAAHVFFGSVAQISAGPVTTIWPDPASLSWAAVALAGIAALLLLGARLPLPLVLGSMALLGVLSDTIL